MCRVLAWWSLQLSSRVLGSPALSPRVLPSGFDPGVSRRSSVPGFPPGALVSCYAVQTSGSHPIWSVWGLVSPNTLCASLLPGSRCPRTSLLWALQMPFPDLPRPFCPWPLPTVTGLPESPLPSVSLLPVCPHADPRLLLSSWDVVSEKAGAGRGPVSVRRIRPVCVGESVPRFSACLHHFKTGHLTEGNVEVRVSPRLCGFAAVCTVTS